MSGKNAQSTCDMLFNILRTGAGTFSYFSGIQPLDAAHIKDLRAARREFAHDPVHFGTKFLEHEIILRGYIIYGIYGGATYGEQRHALPIIDAGIAHHHEQQRTGRNIPQGKTFLV